MTTQPTTNADDEDIREKILTLGPCIGPYDIPHRCSAMHCDHCGICDISEDLLKLLTSTRTNTIQTAIEAVPAHKHYGDCKGIPVCSCMYAHANDVIDKTKAALETLKGDVK